MKVVPLKPEEQIPPDYMTTRYVEGGIEIVISGVKLRFDNPQEAVYLAESIIELQSKAPVPEMSFEEYLSLVQSRQHDYDHLLEGHANEIERYVKLFQDEPTPPVQSTRSERR